MKVTLVGFEVGCEGEVTIEELEPELLKALAPFSVKNHERIIRCAEKNGLLEGVMLTIKTQKSFPILKSGQNYEVTVHQLKQGEQLIDFNYFAWSKKTRRGVYQRYLQSPRLGGFESVLRSVFDALVARRRMADAAQVSTENEKKRVTKKYATCKLELDQIVRPETVDALIKGLLRIDRIELRLAKFDRPGGSIFDPVSRYVKRESFKLSFDQKFKSTTGLKNAVATLFKKGELTRAKVFGRDQSGKVQTVDSLENHDVYGTFDFEDITKSIVMNLDQWQSSPVLAHLRKGASDQFERARLQESRSREP